MMTSIFRFDLGAQRIPMATRPNGQALYEKILEALDQYDLIEIDFANRSPTPSFVDQCIGGVVKSLGVEKFKARVKLRNVSEDARPLLIHVIRSRAP